MNPFLFIQQSIQNNDNICSHYRSLGNPGLVNSGVYATRASRSATDRGRNREVLEGSRAGMPPVAVAEGDQNDQKGDEQCRARI